MTVTEPPARSWASLSEFEQFVAAGTIDELLDGLSAPALRDLTYRWAFYRRPNQTTPEGLGDRYRVWMLLAGRGFGKTRVGAESVREQVERCARIGLLGPTAADVRDVMVEGDSGLLSVFPPQQRPVYEPSKRRVTFHTGAVATLFSAEEPDRLRGPQHEWAWIDEPASMPHGEEALSNLLLALRLGTAPWALITGTPKPLRWLRDLSERPDTITTTGSTYDNRANLAAGFITDVLGRYENTRLGRQELYAEWLSDVEGALWTEHTLDGTRIAGWEPTDPWRSLNGWLTSVGQPPVVDRRPWRTVVAVDPPAETAECGIVVASAPIGARPGVDHAVVLDDASTAGRPEEWGSRVVATARRWNAERVVVESNQGGDMVRATIHAVDPTVRVDKVRATVSKASRAEPVSAMYERGRVHHVGFLPMLESQLVSWVPGDARSPDRLDALVHAVTFLLVSSPGVAAVRSPTHRRL